MPYSPYNNPEFMSGYVLELEDTTVPDEVLDPPAGYARIRFAHGQLQFSTGAGYQPVNGGGGGGGSSVLNATFAGAVDGVNTLFTTAVAFTQIAVYLNGVKQILGSDYVVAGANAIQLAQPPEGGATPDVLTADLVAA